MFDKHKNFAKSTLDGAINASVLELVVAADNFPGISFNAVIWKKNAYAEPDDDPNMEIIRITNKTGTTYTITRAQESTTAHPHENGDRIELNITKKLFEDIEQYLNQFNIIAAHKLHLYRGTGEEVLHIGAGQPAGLEELTDGELDDWASATDLTSWTEDGVSAGVRDIDQEGTEKHSGNYSAKLTATSNDGTTDFGIYQVVSSLPAGDYQVNAWVNLDSRTQGSARVEAYNNTDSAVLATQSLSATGDWREINIRFTITGTKDVKISLYFDNETDGVVYFDLASLKLSETTARDASIYGNNGTLINGVKREDKALSFDGLNDYVNIPDDESLRVTDKITIAAWAKINAMSGYRAIYSKWDTVGTYFGHSPVHLLMFQLGGVSPNVIYSVDTLDSYIGSWAFLVGTYDINGGTNNMKVYINGSLDNQQDASGTISPKTGVDVRIGKYATVYFNGKIDDVRVYNRALTADEIKALYELTKGDHT